jgi:hypothetical protein
VRTIVDLRSDEELAEDPPAEKPVEAVHVSFFDSRPEVFEEVEQAAEAAEDHAAATREVYLIFLEHFRSNVAAAIRAVANAPDGGVVVHCHGGKDRTGLVSAFLLRLAGVPIEEILPTTRSARSGSAPGTRSGSRRLPTRRSSSASTGSRRRPLPRWCRCSRSSSGVTAASPATSRPAARRTGSSTGHGAGSVTEPRVLAVFGPTASGKSDVAEAIADRIPATLISADAMQVYRGLPILTNQSDRETELVAIWQLGHEASVGEYAELAHAAVDRALAGGTTPVVVGGTGLYLRAALVELDLPPAPAPGARDRWEAAYERLGRPRGSRGRIPPAARARERPRQVVQHWSSPTQAPRS